MRGRIMMYFTERLNVEFCRMSKLLLNSACVCSTKAVSCAVVTDGQVCIVNGLLPHARAHTHRDLFGFDEDMTLATEETKMLKANQVHMLCIQPMD